LGYE
jgi:Tfp pilus assembly protein FimT